MDSSSLPCGAVTFLFSDIEGSTRLWELHPAAMRQALRRHDALLRQAVEANHGWVVKTTGDGLHAVFASPAQALAAALAAQLALQAEAWPELAPQALRARMGLHTGEAEGRAGDYYGPAVNRAARLMSAGHGGQVLVSALTAGLAQDDLPQCAGLLDLGEHRLKDLVRPEHIYQLTHPDLPAEFPPILSLDALPNNLPVQLTSFVGRGRELAETAGLLVGCRLLTLTGSGGVGKTRLALQTAAEALANFPGGAWFVELAPLVEPDQVLAAVAAALDLRSMPGAQLERQVNNFLQRKVALVILDNCEHLVHACAKLAGELLRTCPSLKIIASSREGLGVPGEVTYHVPSLSLHEMKDAAVSLASLVASEAAQLFIERARAVNPQFTLDEANAPALAHICRRLDGIPLALELAAARTRLFSVEQVAARLSDRFRLLTGGSRTALPRQQTLRAAIDWSYELLSEPERRLLRGLSVFAGGWSFEAAEAVFPELDVLELLDQLVNKSLVVVEEQRGQARYRFLETIRQYARDRLLEASESEALRNRHLAYYLRLSETAAPALCTHQAFDWFDRLGEEYDNLQSAAEWARETCPAEALRLVGNLSFFWGFTSLNLSDSLNWLTSLYAVVEALPADGDPQRRLRTLSLGKILTAMLTMARGDTARAGQLYDEAIEMERSLGSDFWLGFALSNRSVILTMEGELEKIEPLAREALVVFSRYEKFWSLLASPFLMQSSTERGDLAETSRLREELFQQATQAGHPVLMPIYMGLASEARGRGSYADARRFLSQGARVARRVHSGMLVAYECELAHLDRLEGRLAAAKTAYARVMRIFLSNGYLAAVANLLECYALVALAEEEPARAARLFGAAEALRDAISIPMRAYERQEYNQGLAALRRMLAPAELEAAWSAGRALSVEQAVEEATIW